MLRNRLLDLMRKRFGDEAPPLRFVFPDRETFDSRPTPAVTITFHPPEALKSLVRGDFARAAGAYVAGHGRGAGPRKRCGGATMLNTLVSFIDKELRARQRIFEYSNCPHCIFRAHVAAVANDIALSDGTRLSAGSRVISLHLWNEHVPPFPSRGPTLGWARRLCHDLELSLEELAAFVAGRGALDDVVAIGGKMMFGSARQTEFAAHLAARYGFIRAVDPAPIRSISQRLHDLGENILVSMIVISHNPAALRTDCFQRDRVPVYLHRTELMRRFGKREGFAAASWPIGERPVPGFGAATRARPQPFWSKPDIG